MNEIFDFSRFCKYFKYDLKQSWRSHTVAAIGIGFAGVLFYFIYHVFGLIFGGSWNGIPEEARFMILMIAFTVLEIYQAKTYGYLTEKKAGSSWLMIPASGTEKTISMLLNTCIVFPVLFFVAFLASDWLIAILDPTIDKSIIALLVEGFREVKTDLVAGGLGDTLSISAFPWIFMLLVSMFLNFTYFLLCGICFEKRKIISAFLIILGLSVLFSLISVPAIEYGIIGNYNFEFEDIADGQAVAMLNHFLNWATAIVCVVNAGLIFGVWYRIKTIKH